MAKKLHMILKKNSGRDMSGSIVTRHQGGRHKRYYRIIDFKRNKIGVPAKVLAIQYDPNRSVDIALVQYSDGEKRYILAPNGMEVGTKIMSGEKSEVVVGNAMPLGGIPVGTPVHNIEITRGKGGQIVRSAGGQALIQAREGEFVHLKMPRPLLMQTDTCIGLKQHYPIHFAFYTHLLVPKEMNLHLQHLKSQTPLVHLFWNYLEIQMSQMLVLIWV